jgi:hypothetical protein
MFPRNTYGKIAQTSADVYHIPTILDLHTGAFILAIEASLFEDPDIHSCANSEVASIAQLNHDGLGNRDAQKNFQHREPVLYT